MILCIFISKSVSIFMFTVEMNTGVVVGGVIYIFLRYSFEGVRLNAHCVNISVVNNDASTSLVYSVCCCSASASESSCCEI